MFSNISGAHELFIDFINRKLGTNFRTDQGIGKIICLPKCLLEACQGAGKNEIFFSEIHLENL